MSSYNIVVLDMKGQQLELSRNDSLYKEVSALTERVITALQTDKAISGFSKLSEMWKSEYGVKFDVGESVEDFQALLKNAISQKDLWPTIAVDLGMSDRVDGEFKSPEDSRKTFHIGEQRISLNGLRVFMLSEDRNRGSHEWYPRWLEMFTSYCHQMAHLYVTYLSLCYTGGTTCRTPVTCSTDPFPKDSGFFFEKHLFGGILIRWAYRSRRKYRHMPGLPVYVVDESRFHGIRLEKVLNIANRARGEPYISSDFDLGLYLSPEPQHPENPEHSRNQKGPEKHFDNSPLITLSGGEKCRWLKEYAAKFGIKFAKPADRCILKSDKDLSEHLKEIGSGSKGSTQMTMSRNITHSGQSSSSP